MLGKGTVLGQPGLWAVLSMMQGQRSPGPGDLWPGATQSPLALLIQGGLLVHVAEELLKQDFKDSDILPLFGARTPPLMGGNTDIWSMCAHTHTQNTDAWAHPHIQRTQAFGTRIQNLGI